MKNYNNKQYSKLSLFVPNSLSKVLPIQWPYFWTINLLLFRCEWLYFYWKNDNNTKDEVLAAILMTNTQGKSTFQQQKFIKFVSLKRYNESRDFLFMLHCQPPRVEKEWADKHKQCVAKNNQFMAKRAFCFLRVQFFQLSIISLFLHWQPVN